MSARDRRILLAEALEYRRQEIGLDTDAIVRHGDLDPVAVLSRSYRDMTVLFGELDRIRKQIEQHLLQAMRVALNYIGNQMYFCRDAYSFIFCRRPNCFHGGFD